MQVAGLKRAVPGEEDYAVTPFNDHFFCTEREAKAADYYHDDF
ncbi:hypothetical protein [Microtetraspora malaysiensis]